MTSAHDAARWLLLQLGDLTGPPAAAVAVTQTVAIALPSGVSPFPHLEIGGYGLGWLVATFRDRPMLWHSGGIDGFATQTVLLPEERLGITVSANLHGSSLPLAAVLQLADTELGTAEATSWYDVLRPLAAGAEAGIAPAPVPDDAAPARPAAEVIGSYRNLGYGDLIVLGTDQGLQVRLGESDLSLRHVDGDTWEMRYEVLGAPYALEFEAAADGAVTAAVAPLDPSSIPIRFERVGG